MCPGYANRFKQVTSGQIEKHRTWSRSTTLLAGNLATCEVHITKQDGHAYDFYRSVAAQSLAHCIDNDLWYNLVLQYGQVDTAIRYAVTAVGYLSRHTATCLATTVKPCTCSAYRSAIKQYSRSIVQLQKHATFDRDVRIPRMACALFICIEALLGNSVQVLRLIDVAMSLHHDWTQTSETPLLEFFQRLRIYFYLLQQGYQAADSRSTLITTQAGGFRMLSDARRSLYAMIQDTITFVNLPFWRREVSSDLTSTECSLGYAEQHDLLQRFKKWREDCTALSSEMSSEEAFAIMVAHVTLAELWVAVVTQRDEAAFNNTTPAFESIVLSAAKHIRSRQENHQSRPALFNFELSWITPLYYTALKCRNVKLRTQALSLLSCLPKQEGMWQGDRLPTLAKQVISKELESGQLSRDVVAGPTELEDGKVKFRARYYVADSGHTQLAREFQEILSIDE